MRHSISSKPCRSSGSATISPRLSGCGRKVAACSHVLSRRRVPALRRDAGGHDCAATQLAAALAWGQLCGLVVGLDQLRYLLCHDRLVCDRTVDVAASPAQEACLSAAPGRTDLT